MNVPLIATLRRLRARREILKIARERAHLETLRETSAQLIPAQIARIAALEGKRHERRAAHAITARSIVGAIERRLKAPILIG